MDELKSFYEFLSNLSIKKIGIHLKNIANLYKKPITLWRKLINHKKDSYDFFLLIIIYYSIVVYFIVDNPKFVIPITVLELLLTLIPFSFLVLPFIYFRNKWCKKLKTNSLFRLIFVLKIQFGMIYIAILLFVKWAKIESPYVFIENFPFFLFLLFIIIPIIILKIKVYQKLIWILVNYIFFLFYFVFIFLIISKMPESDLDLLASKIVIETPTNDYQKFHEKYQYSDIYMDEKYFIGILHIDNEDNAYLRNVQFAKSSFVLELMKIDSKDFKDYVDKLKQLKSQNNPNLTYSSNYRKTVVSLFLMDSIKKNFDKSFYDDLRLTDSILKKAQFTSNVKIYKQHNRLLKHYDSIYKSSKFIENIVSKKPEYLILSDEKNYIAIYSYHDSKIKKMVNDILLMRKQLLEREKWSVFFAEIFISPINFLFDKFNLY